MYSHLSGYALDAYVAERQRSDRRTAEAARLRRSARRQVAVPPTGSAAPVPSPRVGAGAPASAS
jgi:hypothetical protein